MRIRTQVPGIVGALLLALAPRMSAQIFVDQTAAYRYVNATSATTIGGVPANWFAVGFNDAGWFTGNGPFSSGATSGTILDQGNANGPFAPGPTQPTPATFTQWDIFHDPYLRTYFNLLAPQDLTIWIAVDNGIGVGPGAAGLYFNGVQTSNTINAEGAAFRWEIAFNVPAAYTFAGQNLIALQLEDHGGATGFDMMVTAEKGSNPIFTTNPPPITASPEPGAVVLTATGLALLLAVRRKKGARS